MTASSRRRWTGPARRSWVRGGSENGIALVVSLLLLSLMSVLGIVLMVSVNSDTLINGYYGNYRGSFYAADSGLNIARQQLISQITTAATTTACTFWATDAVSGCTAPPLNLATASVNAIMANVTGQYGSFTTLNAGQGAGSWSEQFEIAGTGTCNTLSATQTLPATALSTTPVYSFTFQYKYNLCAVGQAHGLQRVTTSESGYITITVTSPNTPLITPFSAFGAFIGNYPPCTGALIPGTMGGQMYANGAWQFENGNYIFTGAVSQTNADADYYYGNNCIQSPTASYTSGGTTIKPTFQQGFQLGQQAATLPANDVNQEWAVLNGMGINEASSPAHSDLNAAGLTSWNGTASTVYPATGGSAGVYLPYSGNTLNANAGGIYVEGGASLVLSTGTDTGGQPTQIYAITPQGGTTTTVTIDQNTNTTTIQASTGSAKVLTGIPHDLVTSTPGTMIYVNGAISGLKGTAQGVPAIATNYQSTITANGDVDITGDLIYSNERVTLNAANSATQYANQTQELGIFTATGNIVLQSTYGNKNLQVDGSLAAISGDSACTNSNSNTCGFKVNGSINTFNNVGGQIQYNIFGANMSTQNTYFDGSVVPPFFPGAIMPAGPPTPAAPTVTIAPPQRMSWVTTPQ